MHSHATFEPRLIAWETTKKCMYNCRHCRASALDKDFANELATGEALLMLDKIAAFANPIIILTGGEPMAREDIYAIAEHGTRLGLRMVMAPCGPLITKNTIKRIKDAGIKRISLSIDGADKATHDSFRQVEGAFDAVVGAARLAKEEQLEFQINTTVTLFNYKQLDKILALSLDLGAVAFHPFLLVPTGRGKELAPYTVPAEEYEEVLALVYRMSLENAIPVKPTCAPHYYRIFRQLEQEAGRPVTRETHGMNAMTRGCLGGQGFAFVSNTGSVQICGFLDVEAGNMRKENFDFEKIWNGSELFFKMRDKEEYAGKCGKCEYWRVCGGCRARAYAATGDCFAAEPFCAYEPAVKERVHGGTH